MIGFGSIDFLCLFILFQINKFNRMSQRKGSKNLLTVVSAKKSDHHLTPPSRPCAKSPFSNPKNTHQTQQVQSVSYGQLQIVLENLQNIKQKASQQVKLLNEENISLREEITELKNIIEEMNIKFRTSSEEVKDSEGHWRDKVKGSEREIQEREKKIRTVEMSAKKLQEIINQQGEQINQMRQKWNWAFVILAGDESRAEQLIWKVKHEETDIWKLFESESSLKNMQQHNQVKIDSLTNQLMSSRQECKRSTQMLDKSLTQFNNSNSKIAGLEEKIREYSQFLVSSKEEQHMMGKQIEEGNRQRDNFQRTILDLEGTIQQLGQELAIIKSTQAQKDKKSSYINLVSEICDETEDYSKMLQRLHYLQRFRGEHYKNIEKVQYLCKLLDN